MQLHGLQRAEPPELTFRVDPFPGGARVSFAGDVDENADFAELHLRLAGAGALIFDLSGVRRVNSCGVPEWVSFVRELGEADVTFVACSPAIVTQMNMIYNFRGPARVRSFLAPYVCTRCHAEAEKLLDVDADFVDGSRQVPPFSCPQCAAPMELDDLPDRYLSFLGDT